MYAGYAVYNLRIYAELTKLVDDDCSMKVFKCYLEWPDPSLLVAGLL